MAVFREQDSNGYRFIVRPNCALSWRETKYLIGLFAACLGAIGIWFAVLGVWLVLPFAGLELAALAGGLYLGALDGHTWEAIEIDGPVLRVKRGSRRIQEVGRFPANWTRVVLDRDPNSWYPSRLLLQCQGRGLEVGARLVEAERQALASSLRDALDFRFAPSASVDRAGGP
jgi:uncharacterized membrane protein